MILCQGLSSRYLEGRYSGTRWYGDKEHGHHCRQDGDAGPGESYISHSFTS